MVYIITLVFLFLCGVVEILGDKQQKTVLVSITFVWFTILCGLKYQVGTDYNAYLNLYELPKVFAYNPLYGAELYFWYWMKLFSTLGLGFIAFWLITAIFNLLAKFYVFNKLSPYFFASMLMYFVGLFFERDFDGLRQGIGIGICYFGIFPLLNKQYLLYYLLVFIGYNFHTTCLVFALLPLLQFVNLSVGMIVVILVVGVTFVLLKVDLTEQLIAATPESFVKGRLETYISDGDELFTKSTGLSLGILFRIIIFGLFSYYGPSLIGNERLFNIYRNGFFIAILFSLVFNNIDIVGHRLAYGFREFQIFIIPSFIALPRQKTGKLIVLTLIFLYSLFLLIRLLNTEHLAPYYQYKNVLYMIFTGSIN